MLIPVMPQEPSDGEIQFSTNISVSLDDKLRGKECLKNKRIGISKILVDILCQAKEFTSFSMGKRGTLKILLMVRHCQVYIFKISV